MMPTGRPRRQEARDLDRTIEDSGRIWTPAGTGHAAGGPVVAPGPQGGRGTTPDAFEPVRGPLSWRGVSWGGRRGGGDLTTMGFESARNPSFHRHGRRHPGPRAR